MRHFASHVLGLTQLFLAVSQGAAVAAEPAGTGGYAGVEAILARHCIDCHAAQDPEGKLVLESFDALMKGGESGPSVVRGKSADSLLVKAVEVGVERDGKKKLMPPGKRDKLKPEEVALIKAWIDAGAPAPEKTAAPAERELVLPKIAPAVPPRRSIQSAAYSPTLDLVALARYGEVDLLSPESRRVVRTLKGMRGSVNALAFSADGRTLAAAAGEPALFGEVTLWNATDGSLTRRIRGHGDALYAVSISPDGETLATGSYDQKIKLWNLETGELRHTLSAHNGAIFDLAFRPGGAILASASGDRTVKLWNVGTGKRVETLSQPLKDQYALAWSPDGRRLAAAGSDNRIRVWEISESAAETTNPLLTAKFAHEGGLLNLAWSPDGKTLLSSAEDRTIKLWDTATISERQSFELQPDVAAAVAFLRDSKSFVVGRLDGSVEFYDAEKGRRMPPPRPELNGLEPRGLQRGTSGKFRLTGKHLAGVTNVMLSNDGLLAVLDGEPSSGEIHFSIRAADAVYRGSYDLSVAGAGGESAKLKLFVDELPQLRELDGTNLVTLPVSFWGVLDPPAQSDELRFRASAGQTVVLDLAARSVGSKLQNAALTLFDASGSVLGGQGGFDGDDRFLAVRIPADGTFTARVADQMLGGSKDHFYRLSIGVLPVVTGVFPLSVPTNAPAEVQLVGVNLPPNPSVTVKAGAAGELAVPMDGDKFRARRTFKVLVADAPQMIELEPNDTPAQATPVPVPCAVNGRIFSAAGVDDRPHDVDCFRFEARAGQPLILETDAARRGSPVDTKIEIQFPDGKPVPRLLLQAVRNTAINFRGIDSNGNGARLDHYEEMELNEYLYLNGDVMRLFRMPQGPDSDMLFHTSAGKRLAYFDTSATAHALDEQGFIVEPLPLGAKVGATGLPVFTLHYENDDDGERRLGVDSRVSFNAPTNGAYLVRVTDTRGQGGETFAYRLVVREARPDFTVALSGGNPSISPGSGQSFTLNAERLDGFDGEIRVDLTGVPAGFSVSTPIVIEAGLTEAKGTLFAAIDAAQPDGTNVMATKVTASALVAGRKVTKDVNGLSAIKLADRPKLFVSLEPEDKGTTNQFDPGVPPVQPLEITMAPGQTIPARLKIKRNGHEDLVTFFAENLPHGVIVADIGLNGVLIPKGESERQIFFNAARWVPEQDRLFYMIEQQAGRQTSRPVLLKVRKPTTGQAATGK